MQNTFGFHEYMCHPNWKISVLKHLGDSTCLLEI